MTNRLSNKWREQVNRYNKVQWCLHILTAYSHVFSLHVQCLTHAGPKLNVVVKTKRTPFLLLAEEWQAIQKLQLWAVEHDLLTEEGTHSVDWVEFTQIFASICDAPNMKTGDSRNSGQIEHSEFFEFCVTHALNKNIHVQQWTMAEAKDLHLRCVPEEVWPTETGWWHIETCQIGHVLQSCLGKSCQTRVTHLCVFVCDFLDFVTEAMHEQKCVVVVNPVVTQNYLFPNQLVTYEWREMLVCLWQVKQRAWVQMSCNFHNDVSRHWQQLQYKHHCSLCKLMSSCANCVQSASLEFQHTMSVLLSHCINFLGTCTNHLNVNTTQRVTDKIADFFSVDAQPQDSHILSTFAKRPMSCLLYTLFSFWASTAALSCNVMDVHHCFKSSNQLKWEK